MVGGKVYFSIRTWINTKERGKRSQPVTFRKTANTLKLGLEGDEKDFSKIKNGAEVLFVLTRFDDKLQQSFQLALA